MDILNIITINKAKMSSITLCKATVRDSELRNVALHNSTIYGSTFTNSKLFNCAIYSSKLTSSELRGVKIVKCEVADCEISAAPPSLSKLPREVREMIFELALPEDGSIKTPSLLAALRGHEELYFEALQIFYKTTPFVLTEHSYERFAEGENMDLSNKAVKNIHILMVESDVLVEAADFPQRLAEAKGITELHLEFEDDHEETSINLPEWIEEYLALFKDVAKMSLSCESIPGFNSYNWSCPEVFGTRDNPKFRDAIDCMEKCIGDKAHTEIDASGGMMKWTWQAQKGKALSWGWVDISE